MSGEIDERTPSAGVTFCVSYLQSQLVELTVNHQKQPKGAVAETVLRRLTSRGRN